MHAPKQKPRITTGWWDLLCNVGVATTTARVQAFIPQGEVLSAKVDIRRGCSKELINNGGAMGDMGYVGYHSGSCCSTFNLRRPTSTSTTRMPWPSL